MRILWTTFLCAQAAAQVGASATELSRSVFRLDSDIDGHRVVGTGFVVRRGDQCIGITASHLLRGSSSVVISADVDGEPLSLGIAADAVMFARDADLAFVSLPLQLSTLPALRYSKPVAGDAREHFLVVGYKRGRKDTDWALFRPSTSAEGPYQRLRSLMSESQRVRLYGETSPVNFDAAAVSLQAPVQPGQSGSPVINKDGEVVAMVLGGRNQGQTDEALALALDDSRHVGFASSSFRASGFADKRIIGGVVSADFSSYGTQAAMSSHLELPRETIGLLSLAGPGLEWRRAVAGTTLFQVDEVKRQGAKSLPDDVPDPVNRYILALLDNRIEDQGRRLGTTVSQFLEFVPRGAAGGGEVFAVRCSGTAKEMAKEIRAILEARKSKFRDVNDGPTGAYAIDYEVDLGLLQLKQRVVVADKLIVFGPIDSAAAINDVASHMPEIRDDICLDIQLSDAWAEDYELGAWRKRVAHMRLEASLKTEDSLERFTCTLWPARGTTPEELEKLVWQIRDRALDKERLEAGETPGLFRVERARSWTRSNPTGRIAWAKQVASSLTVVVRKDSVVLGLQ